MKLQAQLEQHKQTSPQRLAPKKRRIEEHVLAYPTGFLQGTSDRTACPATLLTLAKRSASFGTVETLIVRPAAMWEGMLTTKETG